MHSRYLLKPLLGRLSQLHLILQLLFITLKFYSDALFENTYHQVGFLVLHALAQLLHFLFPIFDLLFMFLEICFFMNCDCRFLM